MSYKPDTVVFRN